MGAADAGAVPRGAPADALASYRRVRGLLAEDLGVDPGAALRDLEERMLGHDPTLFALDDAPRPVVPVVDRCPYLGLTGYEESDAALFVGRERLTSVLVGRLSEQPVVVLTGASGVGKSSLVRAGLVPGLRAGALPSSSAWRVEMRAATADLELGDIGRPVDLLVVDQGEAMFTGLTPEERDRLVRRSSSTSRTETAGSSSSCEVTTTVGWRASRPWRRSRRSRRSWWARCVPTSCVACSSNPQRRPGFGSNMSWSSGPGGHRGPAGAVAAPLRGHGAHLGGVTAVC